MRRLAALCSFLFIIGSNASYLPWLGESEYCVQACGIIYSKVWFDAKKPSFPCKGKNAVKSLFYCAAQHCTGKDLVNGLLAANETCTEDGHALPSFEAFRSNPKATPLRMITIVSAKEAKKTNFTEPVLPSEEWFDLAYRSTIVRQRSFMLNFSFSFALYGYWALVLLVATLWRAETELKTDFQPFLIHPLLAGSQHQVTITRAEALAILGHTVVAFIFCFVGYEDVKGNIYAPDHKLNLAKLISNRLGTIALAHIPLVWMFAARNNPLLWLMGWPYHTFSQFHRWVARMLAVLAVGHAIGYSLVRHYQGIYHEMWSEPYWRYGVAAVVFMCSMLALSTFWLRKKAYDLFLMIHIALAIITVPMLWMHYRVLEAKDAFRGFLWPAIAIWIFDRLLRFARMLYLRGSGSSAQNSAIISGSQSSELLRIEFTDRLPALSSAAPGRYYFLYEAARWRGYESHPFTLCTWPDDEHTPRLDVSMEEKAIEAHVSEIMPASKANGHTTEPASRRGPIRFRQTFLIRPQDGFTRHLQEKLSAPSPETRVSGDESIVISRPLRLLIEGPYGHRPALRDFTTLMLFVGGSGITAAVSLIYDSLQAREQPQVHLVWAVRRQATSDDVCSHELKSAIAHPRFQLDVYLTNDHPRIPDVEKTALPTEPRYRQSTGRPDMETIVHDEVNKAKGQVAVFCCGPSGMEATCRRAVAGALAKKGNLALHVERFGW